MKAINLDINKEVKGPSKITQEKPKLSPSAMPKEKSHIARKIVTILLSLVAIVVVGSGIYLLLTTLSTLDKSGIKVNVGRMIGNSLKEEKKQPQLRTDGNGRVNILIAGIDTRQSKAGSGLKNTDTIIAATLNQQTNQVSMISIPRDVWVENPRHPGYHSKINAIYALGEGNKKGTGMEWLQETVQNITGLTFQYYMMIDVAGATKALDKIGGIDITVDRTFTGDYPSGNYYRCVTVKAGRQHMTGIQAIEYARMRKCNACCSYSKGIWVGSEYVDWARARRQQKVIIATKEKMMRAENLLNPIKISEIIQSVGSSLKTTKITDEDILAGITAMKKVKDGEIYSMVLDPASGNFKLIAGSNPYTPGSYPPKAGIDNWTVVRKFVTGYINNPGPYSENAKVYVYNGGLGATTAKAKQTYLSSQYPFLNVTYGGNQAGIVNGVTIVSFSKTPKKATLELLKKFYKVDVAPAVPAGIRNVYGEDIAVIFGKPVVKPTTQPTQPAQPTTQN